MIEPLGQSAPRRVLRLINPRSPLSTITMPEIIRKMTFSRRAIFMPLNLAICAAVVPEGWDAEIIDENVLDVPTAQRRRHRRRGHRRHDHAGPPRLRAGRRVPGAGRAGDPGRHPPLGPAAGGPPARRHRLPGRRRGHAALRPARPGGRNGCTARRCAGRRRGQPGTVAGFQRAGQYAGHGGGAQAHLRLARPPRRPHRHAAQGPAEPQGLPGLQPHPDHPRLPARLHVLHHAGHLRPAVPPAVDRRPSSEEIATAKERFSSRGVHLLRRRRRRQPGLGDGPVRGPPAAEGPLGQPVRHPDRAQRQAAGGHAGQRLHRADPGAGKPQRRAPWRPRASGTCGRRSTWSGSRKIHSHRISLWGSFIFGFDSDDWRDCMAAVRFAQRARLA